MSEKKTPSFVTASFLYAEEPANGARAYVNSSRARTVEGGERNWTKVTKEVQIENIRDKENAFTLDNSGFQFFKRPTNHSSFADDEEIKSKYYLECADLIKEITGARTVMVHSHLIRRYFSDLDTGVLGPVAQAHVDQTPKSAVAKVYRYLPEHEASELLKRRFQIINLWRPIGHPSFDWPLALCDYRSVDPAKDLMPTTLTFPDHDTESFFLKYNSSYQWKYLRGMTPDEAVLIKCFDSVQDGSVAVHAPHVAFKDPTMPVGAPARHSIEVRSFVFYD